ncbi:MAG: PKD domain-containing protein [Bacteroidales bacterium]|nr:PKD domain-containing protein [Bacteroidales bacterium]
MLKRLFYCLFFVLAGISLGFAQTQVPTTQGTEFWVSFMRNGYRNGTSDHLRLIASAKRSCQVTVTNVYTGTVTNTFTVSNQGVQTVEIATSHGYNEQQGGNAYKGLLVTSTDTISLYIANEAQNSYDAANVLPIQALGSFYMVQSNKSIGEQSSHQDENRASFLIIATEDNTQVRIIPTCETWDDHMAGRPYTVSLQRGECYHVLNKYTGSESNGDGDFSGTTIESLDEEKPIAVFNGNCITAVPGGTTSGYDHVFEQAMPVDHWGKRFVVTSTEAPSYFNLLNDMVKVTASADNTIVQRDGRVLCQLNAGESYTFEMDLDTEPCTFLESDNPIAVYLYNHSHRQASSGTTYGDPSMVWISPVEQTIREITFSTFQAENVQKHFVNVVCYTEHVAELMYDNSHIPNSFTTVPSAPEFSYARVEVPAGAHTILCPGGFVAHVYGMGPNEGYAYTVGSSAKTLTKQLYVNDILSTELPDGCYSVCQGDASIQFRVSFNFEYDHVTWDFGDGTTGVGEEISHTYTMAGDYEVTAVVYREIEGSIQPFDSLQVIIHVTPLIEITVIDSTCANTYYFHGQPLSVPNFDQIIGYNDEGCDTIYHMSISSGQTASAPPRYDTLCEGNVGIMWFDTLRTDPGTYIVIKSNGEDDCDSLFMLHLAVVKLPENPIRPYASCSAYDWGGVICEETGDYYRTFTTLFGCEYDSILHFTRLPSGDVPTIYVDTCDMYPAWWGKVYTESGFHYDTIIGDNGCESYLTLDLTLHSTPPFERIVGLTQVAVSNSFWPGVYNYYLDDSTGMDVSGITWELLDNPEGPGEWEIVPHGASCTITAYSMGERVLRVSSGNSLCDKEVFKTINCSGYGVGEEETANLEVYPNPASDAVTVKGCAMNEVNVYNLLGQKLKTVSAHGTDEVRVAVGDLPPALYLFEVGTRGGNKTRLVSVIR